MEFLTTTILSGVVYDLLKHGLTITAQNLKDKMRDWIIDNEKSEQLETHITHLGINDEMSESAIEKRFSNSAELINLLNEIKPANSVNISQVHYGVGDNVGGDKIVNN
jgi:hypothetical protein